MKLDGQIIHHFFRFKERTIEFEIFQIFPMSDFRHRIQKLMYFTTQLYFTDLYVPLTKGTIVQNQSIWRVK